MAPKLKISKKRSKGVQSDTRFPIKERVGGKRSNYKLKGNVGNEDNDESESEHEESEIAKSAPKLKNSKKQTKGDHSDNMFPSKERVGGNGPNYKLKGNAGNEDNDWDDDFVKTKESKIAKSASKLNISKKGTKRVHSVTSSEFDDVDLPKEDDSGLSDNSEVGEQIRESVGQHLLEDDDHDLDAELAEIAQVAEERANREDSDSDDEPLIKRKKLDNEREDSVPHAASEDNNSATDIVPRINIPSVSDVNIDPLRKRRKYKPKADVGNEDSDSGDDFVQTTPKKIAKAASNLRGRKKRGKGVIWVTKFQFDDDGCPLLGSDIEISLQTDYLRHKRTQLKAGESVIYWCKYGKRIRYNCSVKVKTLRIDKIVLYMEELNGKDHDHTEDRKARCYEHYSREKLETIREGIRSDIKPRFITKNLKKKKLLCDETMPSKSSMYHKFNRVRHADGKDQVKITVAEFKQLCEDNSFFPENEHEAFVAMHWVDEYAGHNADELKYVAIFFTPALINKYLRDQDNKWCLLLDGTYQN